LRGYKSAQHFRPQKPKTDSETKPKRNTTPTPEQNTEITTTQNNDNSQSIGKVVEALRKANGDISIATCAVGAGGFIVALKSGCKLAAIGRRAFAVAGESIAKAFVRLTSKIKKSTTPKEINEANQSITGFFNKVRDCKMENNPHFTERFKSVINAIVAKQDANGGYVEDVGQKVVNGANKIGLYFKAPLALDFAIASAIAVPAATKAAETTEGAIDKHNIKSSAFENIKVMKDTATLIKDITDGLVY
jgi:ribose 5-phosphate isomerase RpiB